MLEACIQMGLFFEAHNFLKVRMIYMSIYTEQPLKYCLHNILKVGRKWRTCM